MFNEIIRGRRDTLRARLQAETGNPLALLILVGAAWLSFMIYVLIFVQPLALVSFWQYNQVNLYSFSHLYPYLRFALVAAFVILGGFYVLAWQAARYAQGVHAWLVVIWGALAAALALMLVYPFGSTDIFDYILHGRMVGIYGSNPFTHVGYEFTRDPFFPYMGWPGATSAYGPLWEMMAGGLARIAGTKVVTAVLTFKALSGVFFAGSVAMVALILRRVAPERALAGTLLLAWNPLVLYETFANGHNDIVMVFFILLGAYLLRSRHYTLAVVALVVGGLIKFMPLLLIPAAGLLALRDLPDWRARIRFVLLTGALSLGLIVLAYRPFWVGPEVLSITRRQELFTTSLPAVVHALLTPLMGAPAAADIISKASAVLTVLFASGQAIVALKDASWRAFFQASFNTFMFYLLAAVLWFMPWYSLWPLSLAVLLPGRSMKLGLLFAFVALLQPVLFVPWFTWDAPPPQHWQQLGLAGSAVGLPWLYNLLGRLPFRV